MNKDSGDVDVPVDVFSRWCADDDDVLQIVRADDVPSSVFSCDSRRFVYGAAYLYMAYLVNIEASAELQHDFTSSRGSPGMRAFLINLPLALPGRVGPVSFGCRAFAVVLWFCLRG